MKLLKNKPAFKVASACVFFLLIGTFPGSAAEIDDGLAKCAGIKDDDTARLQCFDDLAKKQNAAKESVNLKPVEKKDAAVIVEKAAAKGPAEERKAVSVMEKYWDMSLDPNKERNIFALWPYRPCFFLPLAYNSSPNEDTNLDFDPKAKAQYNEVKFQLSFKFKIWRDIVRSSAINDIIEKSTGIRGVDIWVAYTQQSFWQLYNSGFSAPFRDTNYEPELLFNFRMQREIPGLMGTKLQFINLGFNHQTK
jgi:phospholipase A1